MTRAHEQRGTGGGGSPGTWSLPARVRGCIYSVHNGEPFRSVTQTGEEGGDRDVQGDLEVERVGLSVGMCGREEDRLAPHFPG